MCDATQITGLEVLDSDNHLYIVTIIMTWDSDSNFVSVLKMESFYRNSYTYRTAIFKSLLQRYF